MRRAGDVWAAIVIIGLGAVALLIWLRLSGWPPGALDPMSSLGLILISAIVGLGLLVARFRDWWMFRTLRRHVAKMRDKQNAVDRRGRR